MSEAPTPFDTKESMQDFLDLRDSLRAGRLGGGGREVCVALTSSLDGAIQALADDLDPDSELAVVAVGGYGRSELSLFSDVDLMLLHETDDASLAAAAIFRPMWDAGLRLGHAVRTLKEATTAARERFDTFTTLLTSRFVAGDEELFERLMLQVSTVTRARPLRRYLVNEERARRQHSPYLLMATDVKVGRGGLRTLHGFEWERRREGLIGRFSAPSGPEEDTAREALLAVRNALHASAGRPYDTFSYDLREPAARWLGTDEFEVASSLVDAMQTVDRLATQRWPQLADTADSLGRKAWHRFAGRENVPDDGDDFGAYAALLRSGEKGRLKAERLREAGDLEVILPEWGEIKTIPQLAPFHEHPVEAHLWRTVDEMHALVDGDDRHYSAVAAEVGSPDVLTLAAFLHDIGKGQGGDHAAVGACIARSFCERTGRPADVSRLIEGAVRHHLLLSQTATRRDLDDPAVITEVVDTVGNLRLLQVLYLLTVADSKATGATMWNKWKATLVRTLFVRCAARFGADQPESTATGTTRERVLVAAGADRGAAVESHLDGMPDEYLRSTPTDEVLWHLELIEGMTESKLGLRSGEAADTVVVVGRGREGLRRLVAEVFAANGIDVLEARMASRADAVVVDTFRVRDDRTGGPVSPDRWERACTDIEAALSGALDTESKVAARAEAYSTLVGVAIEPEVRVSVDGASNDGLITIKCSDRIGRLVEILSILSECDLEIRLAKLDSRGGEVVDTFHVHSRALPEDASAVARLERRIEESITS